MDKFEKVEKIINDEISSRINSYVFLDDLCSGKSLYFRNLKNIQYINFEEIAQDFFSKSSMTIRVFSIGKFFKEIKNKLDNLDEVKQVVIIDNLEIIQNILYLSEKEDKGFYNFFKDLVNQVYKQKVIFVFSDIRKMSIKKYLIESKFPEKNIIK